MIHVKGQAAKRLQARTFVFCLGLFRLVSLQLSLELRSHRQLARSMLWARASTTGSRLCVGPLSLVEFCKLHLGRRARDILLIQAGNKSKSGLLPLCSHCEECRMWRRDKPKVLCSCEHQLLT